MFSCAELSKTQDGGWRVVFEDDIGRWTCEYTCSQLSSALCYLVTEATTQEQDEWESLEAFDEEMKRIAQECAEGK